MPERPKQYRAVPTLKEYKRPDTRPTSTERGYDEDWAALRKWYVAKHPVCERCGALAKEVDHVVPIRVAPERRLDAENLMALCLSCHRLKTARDKRGK